MAIKSKVVHIAACDIAGCGAVAGEDEQWAYHFDTPEAALAWASGAVGWSRDGDLLICSASDAAHDAARIPGLLL